MQSLEIVSIVALVVATIIAIVVWSIVFIEYRRILRQRIVPCVTDRIIEKSEDPGNESGGDQDVLSALVEMGHDAPWDINVLYCCRTIVGHSLLWGTCVERSKHHSILCFRC
uniref:Protein Vpu n=1 Tax=Human immunodeficiency virus type 1 TaxID=11676 RepID=Q2NN97_HV1|nr:vpu protein [Human immunodeficiency virus 1]